MEIKVNLIILLSVVLVALSIGALVLLRERIREFEDQSIDFKSDARMTKGMCIVFGGILLVLMAMVDQIEFNSVWTFAGAFVLVVVAFVAFSWIRNCWVDIREHQAAQPTKES
jgi:hypothetical protein